MKRAKGYREAAAKVEAHLIGFDGTLYGSVLEVDFLDRLRTIRTFAGIDELKAQLQSDVRQARAIAEQ